MPARPRGLLEPCAATSGTHGSEEGGAGKRRPLSDIYKASTGQYSETELPGSFGPAAGTPEQGIDDTFILYAGPRTGN